MSRGMPPVQLVFRPAIARLSRKAFVHNLKEIRARLQKQTAMHAKNCEMMAVVKANSYGHQNERIVPELLRNGVKAFCVASLEEGIALRKLAKSEMILVLGGTPRWNRGSLDVIRKHRFHIGVNDLETLKFFLSHEDVPLHVKLDTGMNRLGLKYHDWSALRDFLRKSKRKLHGLYSHYACFKGPDFRKQVLLFNEAAQWLWDEGIQPKTIHSENSAALFSDEKFSKNMFLSEHGNFARPGLSMYGYLPRNFHLSLNLKPVLELSSEVGWVKSIQKGEGVSYDFLYRAPRAHEIGVLPIGYADGIAKSYRQDLKPVLMDKSGSLKARLEICGSICMDTLMVKSNRKSILKLGDRVVFWGHQSCEFVKKRLACPYELNLRIANRIPRVWVP